MGYMTSVANGEELGIELHSPKQYRFSAFTQYPCLRVRTYAHVFLEWEKGYASSDQISFILFVQQEIIFTPEQHCHDSEKRMAVDTEKARMYFASQIRNFVRIELDYESPGVSNKEEIIFKQNRVDKMTTTTKHTFFCHKNENGMARRQYTAQNVQNHIYKDYNNQADLDVTVQLPDDEDKDHRKGDCLLYVTEPFNPLDDKWEKWSNWFGEVLEKRNELKKIPKPVTTEVLRFYVQNIYKVKPLHQKIQGEYGHEYYTPKPGAKIKINTTTHLEMAGFYSPKKPKNTWWHDVNYLTVETDLIIDLHHKDLIPG